VLDVHTGPSTRTERILQAAIAPLLRIIVHLAAVTFMDCRSVRELISVRAPVQQAGSGLLPAGLQPMVRRLFYHLDLIGLLPVFANAEEAVINGCQEPSWQPFGECPPAPSERVLDWAARKKAGRFGSPLPLPMPRTTGQMLVALGAPYSSPGAPSHAHPGRRPSQHARGGSAVTT
jgi:anti-anti-sigma factor